MADIITAPPVQPVIHPAPGTAKEPAPDPKPAANPPRASFLDEVKKMSKPADPEAAPAGDPPPNISQKGKADWEAVKAAREAAEKKAAEFEARYTTETSTLKEQLAAKEKEIAEARAAFDPAEVARLREEHAALKADLNLADVTKTPEWKQHFVAPIEAATKAALELVPESERAKVGWYLQQPRSPERKQALREVLGMMDLDDQIDFKAAQQAIDGVRERRDALLSENQGLVERVQKGRETDAQLRSARQKQEDQKAFDAVQARVVAFKMPWAYDEAEYEKASAEGTAKARQYFDAPDVDTRARVAHWAAFGEAALPQIKALQEQLAAERATVAKLTAAGTKPPSGSGGSGAAGRTGPKGGEFMAAIRGGG